MGKIHSIKQLDSMGLNVPELLLEIGQFDQNKAVTWEGFYLKEGARTRTSLEEKSGAARLSIRTERDGEVLCPHYPNITLRQSDTKVRSLHRKGYGIYIFRGINPQNCIAKGNVFWRKQGEAVEFVVEYTTGGGTVRDNEGATIESFITQEGRLQQDVTRISGDQVRAALVELLTVVAANKDSFANSIVEWSYYNRPIGKRNLKLIFWEIRAWK